MGFLGHVNIFHGRVENGKALLGPIAVDYPEHHGLPPQAADGYARPHELDLGRTDDGGGLWATVRAVNATGGIVKVELADETAQLIHAEVSRDVYTSLGAAVGDRLYVKPRTVRVFLADTKTATVPGSAT